MPFYTLNCNSEGEMRYALFTLPTPQNLGVVNKNLCPIHGRFSLCDTESGKEWGR